MIERKPAVRWRYRLLATFSFLWFLFLPQALLARDNPNFDFSWTGAFLWMVVLFALAGLTVREWRKRFDRSMLTDD